MINETIKGKDVTIKKSKNTKKIYTKYLQKLIVV